MAIYMCHVSKIQDLVFLPSCTQDKSDERIQETLLVGYECKGWYNMYITKSNLVPGTDGAPGTH